MTTDPAKAAREDVQRHLNRTLQRVEEGEFNQPARHWDQAIDVGPETIVSSQFGRPAPNLGGRIVRSVETPAATHPENASGVSKDAGTVESASVVESAARVIAGHEATEYGWPDGWDEATPARRTEIRRYAQALADAGLLADPDEVRRLRDYDRQMRIELAESVPRYERDKAIRERDRARDVAAALEAENARLRTWLPPRIVEQPLLFGTAYQPRHVVSITESMRTYCDTCSTAHQDWVTPDECPQLGALDVPDRVVPAVRAEAAQARVRDLEAALRELRESTKHSAMQRYIIDRALSGEEQR